jgi:hypothetical protein
MEYRAIILLYKKRKLVFSWSVISIPVYRHSSGPRSRELRQAIISMTTFLIVLWKKMDPSVTLQVSSSIHRKYDVSTNGIPFNTQIRFGECLDCSMGPWGSSLSSRDLLCRFIVQYIYEETFISFKKFGSASSTEHLNENYKDTS